MMLIISTFFLKREYRPSHGLILPKKIFCVGVGLIYHIDSSSYKLTLIIRSPERSYIRRKYFH